MATSQQFRLRFLVARDHVTLTRICKDVSMDDFKGTDDGRVGDFPQGEK